MVLNLLGAIPFTTIVLVVLLAIIAILAIVALIVKAIAKINERRYNRKKLELEVMAHEIARIQLDNAGLVDIKIKRTRYINGYNARRKVIYLTKKVYDKTTVSALAIAMKQVAIAINYAKEEKTYKKIFKYSSLSITSGAFFIVFSIVGIILDLLIGNKSVPFTLIFTGLGFLFYSITIALSIKGMKTLKKVHEDALLYVTNLGVHIEEDLNGVKKIYKGMTNVYVVNTFLSIFIALYYFFRFIGVLLKISSKGNKK